MSLVVNPLDIFFFKIEWLKTRKATKCIVDEDKSTKEKKQKDKEIKLIKTEALQKAKSR